MPRTMSVHADVEYSGRRPKEAVTMAVSKQESGKGRLTFYYVFFCTFYIQYHEVFYIFRK